MGARPLKVCRCDVAASQVPPHRGDAPGAWVEGRLSVPMSEHRQRPIRKNLGSNTASGQG